ncbi:hypothetical protein NC651_036407 [Populus alba x Populus x berolinensis]|nr:hypothetical protein NC651_036407 [Populus alba x Populus x berolinensis]
MKYHLARVERGGVKICEKVTPDVQRAAFDKLPDRMRANMPSSSNNIIVTADSDPVQDLEMQQGHHLLDDFSRMDGMTGGEIVLTEETMVPSMLMPDAPDTGLGTEPAGQAFEMDMNNISSSLMKDIVELSSELEQEEPPLFDESLGWMDIWISGETGSHCRSFWFMSSERKRCDELWTALSAIQNHVIILEDLWDGFHPEKVGISRRTNLTRIPFTVSHSLKKIEADPERLLNTVEHF